MNPHLNVSFSLLVYLTEPLLQFICPLGLIRETVTEPPAMTTNGVEVHGDWYLILHQGTIVAQAVFYGHCAVVTGVKNESLRCARGHLQFVAIVAHGLFIGCLAEKPIAGALMGNFVIE